jgi:radical SAM protein with 4Fe4S-binding SPASM domain
MMDGSTVVATPLIDIFIRTGFEQAREHRPLRLAAALGLAAETRYRLGATLPPEVTAREGAPFVMLADDAVDVPAELAVTALEFLLASPECQGVTFGCAALGTMYGDAPPNEPYAELHGTVRVLPAWFAIVRRDALRAADAAFATPEFVLLALAARARGDAFARVGPLGTIDLRTHDWVRDVLREAGVALADDFARLGGRGVAASLVPPQLRIEAVGRETLTPALDARATRSAYPKFTVICPVFKPDYLAQMVASVKRQTWPSWELTMLVDGPPEPARRRIASILAENDDPRVGYAFQENCGTGPARDALATVAAGDFIVSIDDDDELTPDCLEAFASAILRNPGVPFFRGGARLVGLATHDMPPRPRLVIAGISNDPFEVTQPFAIAAGALRALGGFEWDPGLRNAGEDTILFQKIDRVRLETRLIPRVMYHRRLSASNLTLQFQRHECLDHAATIDRLSHPPEWIPAVTHQDLVDGFQRSISSYRRADGQEVLTATRFFQYRTFGTLAETTVDLELTSVCNAVCTFCPREVMPDKTRYMPVALVENLAAELRALDRKPDVVFCGIGESTLHPKLEEITRIVASTGAKVTMTTNGARMTPELFRTLVAAGMAGFNFSLNAATAETHHAIMRLPKFESIVRTIQQILEIRRRECPWIALHVSMVVCKENEHEVEPFVAYWCQSGVTQVWLHPVNNRAGLLSGTVGAVDLARFEARFAAESRVIVDVLREREGHDLCKVANTFNFVSADGDVRLCALDYRRQTQYGNLATDTLLSSHHRKLQAFLAGETRSICETCDFYPRACGGAKADARALQHT